jgi:hypothetical protein
MYQMKAVDSTRATSENREAAAGVLVSDGCVVLPNGRVVLPNGLGVNISVGHIDVGIRCALGRRP